jgi:hypothetical protein
LIIIATNCDSSELGRILDKHAGSGICRYIDLGIHDRDLTDLLESRGFEAIPAREYDETYRVKFIQEYIRMIGLLGKELNSLTWWATDISSKNRFSSNISFFLQKFLSAVEAVDRDDYNHLVILNPSWAIVDSLKNAFEKRKLEFRFCENPGRRWKSIAVSIVKRILFNFLGAAKVAVQRQYARRKLRIDKAVLSSAKNVYIFKTFIYEHSFTKDGEYRDVFFGPLPEYVKRNKAVLIYANILGDYRTCIDRISKCSGYQIVPLELLVSWSDIIAASLRSIFRRIRTRNALPFWGHDVSDLMNNDLFFCHNGIPYNQFLHYWATAKLVRSVSADTFLLTYENNPWEKMCMMAVRKYSSDTAVIGYQHTVVPQSSANMYVSREEKDIIPMPDKILTVGEAPMKIMERYGHFDRGRVEAACALRFDYLFSASPMGAKRNGDGPVSILLALEGIPEVYKLVNYTIRQLAGDMNYRIMIRTHPVLPVEDLVRSLSADIRTIPNFSVSRNRSLPEDIKWADVIMYWGTTVSLEAICLGKPVIHYRTDSILSYDPLFECGYLKRVVSDSTDLRRVISDLNSLSDEDYLREQKEARAYLDRYFFPVTEERLGKFLRRSPVREQTPSSAERT